MTFEQWWPTVGQTIGKVAAELAWNAAVAAERDACALICEGVQADYPHDFGMAALAAGLIRARGE